MLQTTFPRKCSRIKWGHLKTFVRLLVFTSPQSSMNPQMRYIPTQYLFSLKHFAQMIANVLISPEIKAEKDTTRFSGARRWGHWLHTTLVSLMVTHSMIPWPHDHVIDSLVRSTRAHGTCVSAHAGEDRAIYICTYMDSMGHGFIRSFTYSRTHTFLAHWGL